MRNYNDETFLEMVELYAVEVGNISSEEELSDLFDEEVAPGVVKLFGADDVIAMNEAFSHYTDGLCKDGVIHPEQYNNYEYVGRYC